MNAENALKLQQCTDHLARGGYWKLPPEHAITLHPDRAGVLRVAQGQLWATLEGPHHGPANDWGDVVLHGGEQLSLMPGQQVVVEQFGDACNEPAYFSWEPSTGPGTPVPTEESGWCDVRVRPELPLRRVAVVESHAWGQAFSSLRSWLSYFVAGRGRVLAPLESNQP